MTWAFARLAVPGFHRWPDAPAHRDYLGVRHRHLFRVEARVEVHHDGREVEFHDIQTAAASAVLGAYPGGEFGDASCETIAGTIASALALAFGLGRRYRVEVSEDGECGAIVEKDMR